VLLPLFCVRRDVLVSLSFFIFLCFFFLLYFLSWRPFSLQTPPRPLLFYFSILDQSLSLSRGPMTLFGAGCCCCCFVPFFAVQPGRVYCPWIRHSTVDPGPIFLCNSQNTPHRNQNPGGQSQTGTKTKKQTNNRDWI